MDQNKINLMLRVAKMYYEMKMGQQEIGEKENISKSTVSRLLKSAMDEGYVEVRVKPPMFSAADLESELSSRFSLRKAVVVPDMTGDPRVLLQDVAGAMAEDLPKYINDHSVLGVAWGRTLNGLIQLLPKMRRENVIVIQLNGGSSRALYESGATEIVRAFKNAVEGDGYLLPAPAIVDEPRIAQVIMEDSQIASVLALAKRCETAVFSVGHIAQESVLYELGCFTPLEYKAIGQRAVGDVCSHFIDLEGQVVDPVLDARVVGTPLDQIKHIKNKLLIAVGIQKERALLGALRGGFADVLYVDEPLAKAVLALDKAVKSVTA